jgi:hypothetical protein
LNDRKQEKNDTKINYFIQLTNFTFYEAIKFPSFPSFPAPFFLPLPSCASRSLFLATSFEL